MRKKPFAMRLLSMIMALLMIVGTLPMHSFAEELEAEDTVLTEPAVEETPASEEGAVKVEKVGGETTYYDTLQKAFDAIDGFNGSSYTVEKGTVGGTYVITLQADSDRAELSAAVESYLGEALDVTLDLAGHSITSSDSTKSVLSVKIGTANYPSTFTVKDSYVDEYGNTNTGKITGGRWGIIFEAAKATLNFNGGTITNNHGGSVGGGICCSTTSNQPVINLNGGIITGNSVTGSSSDNSGYGGGVYACQINVNGTIITGNYAYGGSHAQSGRGGGIATPITGTSAYNVVKINTNTVYGNFADNAGDDLMIQKNGMSTTKHTLVIGTENWYIDGWNGTKATTGNGETDRYSAENPVPYADGGFEQKYNIHLGLKYVESSAPSVPSYTVTYTDGVEDAEIFADQVYTVAEGEATPAFEGTPVREGYEFLGWEPAVSETVTAEVTYVAQWREAARGAINGVGYREDNEGITLELEDVLAYESVAIKVYSGETLLTTVSLRDIEENKELLGAAQDYLTVSIRTYDESSSWEATAWEPTDGVAPTKFELYIDGALKDTLEEAVDVEIWNALKGTVAFFTVTYTDGVEGEEIFADQTYTVKEGDPTPAYTAPAEPHREGYIFAGWAPEVSETVTADATYTAQWEKVVVYVAQLESTGEKFETLQAALDAAAAAQIGDLASDKVTLLNNTTECVTLSWLRTNGDIDLTIDLNGYTVTGNGTGSVIVISGLTSGNGRYHIVIDDSSEAKTGTITGGNATSGGAVKLDGAKANDSLTINGGNFVKNTATTSGGALYSAVVGARIIVNGGTFTGNTAASGGAISAYSLEIHGGTITGNTANGEKTFTGRGGAIVMWGSVALDLDITGGQIYGNTATRYGDDIVFCSTNKTTASMSLISAADMKVDGVTGWFVDGYNGNFTSEANLTARHDPANAVEFTQYANFGGSAAMGIAVALKASYAEVAEYTVTYTDGVEDAEIFADQVYTVKEGEATPAFEGTPSRTGYTFEGWTPEVAETVTADAVYTATWAVNAPAAPTANYLYTMSRGYVVYMVENYNVNADGTSGTPKVSDDPRFVSFNAEPDTYELSEVYMGEDGSFYVDLTITDLEYYLMWFQEEHETSKEKYDLDDANNGTITATLKWNGSRWLYEETDFNANQGKFVYVVHTKHNYGTWTVEKEATCTEDGLKSAQCEHLAGARQTHTQCNCITTQVIPALGHDYVDGVCTRCGEKDPDYVAAPEAPIADYLYTMSRGYVVYMVENYNVNADGTSGTPKVSDDPRFVSFNAEPDTYELSEVYKGEDGSYYVDLTITDLEYYVMWFQEEHETSKEKYDLDDANNGTITATLKWNGSRWLYEETDFNANQGKFVYVVHTKHNYGTWTVEKEATCTEDGLKTAQCEHLAGARQTHTQCNCITSQVIPALGHDYVDGVCTRCGEKDPDYVAPPAAPTADYLYTMSRGYVVYMVENYNVNADGTSGTPKVSDDPRFVSFNAEPDTYELSEVYKGEDGSYYVDLTITDLEYYLMWFQEEHETSKEKYDLDDANNGTITATLKWNGSRWLYEETDFNANQGKFVYVVHTKHNYGTWTVEKEATCTEDGLKTAQCEHLAGARQTHTQCNCITTQVIPALGHDYVDGVCTRCGEKDPDYVEPAPEGVVRVKGKTRYETGFAVANYLKEVLGVEQFEAVVIANGENFPDALAGSYLAHKKNAPILLTNKNQDANVLAYIEANLVSGGKVYILGGTAAVSQEFEDGLVAKGIDYARVKGATRYETNLEILKEAGITADQKILIATGNNYADSLSASATGLPMVLVGKGLTDAQKTFLETTSKNFVILGGEGAVSAEIEAELAAMGTVERVKGKTRYETSVEIAKYFFTAPESAVLGYANNFPDGLCAGPLAIALKAPLILTADGNITAADAYIENITSGVVTGGEARISDDSVREIFELAADAEIPVV